MKCEDFVIKLCKDNDCKVCFQKSFASHEKAVFWSEKNRKVKPRDVSKNSNNKYLFDCEKCGHEFKITLSDVNKKHWCSFCVNKELCKEENCKICFEKSFASHEKSKCWSEKNGNITPRDVFKNSRKKCWFNCNSCSHDFEIILGNLMKGHWCNFCANHKLCNKENCQNCFNNSFASHPRALFWSEKNGNITPRDVFKGSNKKYWFDCNVCNHFFDISLGNVVNSWCPFCVNQKLCEKEDCKSCFEKSFASYEKSKFWSDKNKEKPRNVSKGSNKKYWFNCHICNHTFENRLSDLTKGGWCSFCGNKQLCKKEDCKLCFEKSFASHDRSLFWSKKNGDLFPRNVFKGSDKKYWFICEYNHEFEMRLNCVNRGSWCSFCIKKTEVKLFDWLKVTYNQFDIIKQPKFDWCKNKTYLPFDFLIENLKILIELDGQQHFEDVKHFKSSAKENQERDKYKQQCAISNGYTLIRLLQKDVWNDINNWKEKLQKELKVREIPSLIFLCNHSYVNH